VFLFDPYSFATMHILSRLRHHISLPELARFILLLPSLFLPCLLCFPEALAEPLSVNPIEGADSETCGITLQFPCKTIQYSLINRKATALSLSPGVFNESSVRISDIPNLIINGTIGTVFDCSLRTNSSGLSDPAFIFSNATVVISHLVFQNCMNLRDTDGVGGALSANSSNLNISDCFFSNNVAQVGGAIGAIFGKLVVSSSVFQSNTATCPNSTSMSPVCSAWGGAIGTVEAQEITVIGCSFISNMVDVVFDGVTNPNSTSAAGGGCISVMHKGNVSESHIAIVGNTFAGCLVKMFGLNSSLTTGIQYGNTYGGAVSVYFGRSALFAVNVVNAATSFSNNQCFNSGIVSSVGVSGNAYGGCLSVYAGAWNVNMQSHASLSSVYVSRMQMIISSNNIVNCSAVMTSSSWSSSGNVYGGAISVYVGHCVVGRSSSTVSGNTIVTDSVYKFLSNALHGCNSSSIASGAQNEGIGSFGANVYGGGVSMVVGSYSLSFANSASETGSSNSTVLGRTAVTNTSYIITDNTFIDCAVVSAVSGLEQSGGDKSHGANVYGGGMSLTVGAYSYSFSTGQRSSISVVSGSTQVIDSNYHLARNVLTRCRVLSIAQSLEVRGGLSVGANAHGGGMSLVVGAYSYSYSLRMSSSSVFGTTVSGSSYMITDNRLTSCNASSYTLKNESFYNGNLGIGFGGSFGTNAHGGGISLIVGAYSHSFGVLSTSDSLIYGENSVSDVNLSISGNSMINCIASSATSGGGGSFGGNSYGGGISLMVGGYSYGLSKRSRSSSNVSGVTLVGHTNNTMVNNTFTGCHATSTTGRSVTEGFGSYGVSVYGGGLSFNVGAYSFSSSLCSSSTSDENRCTSYEVSSNVSGDTVFNDVYSVVTRNMFTGCFVQTETSRNLLPGAQNSLNDGSFGANAYGGALSYVIGPYCYTTSNTFSSSSIYGSVIHNDTKLFVNNNVFLNCKAMSISSGGGGSNAANSYGGGVSLLVGAYSYSYTFPTIQKSRSISIVSGITAVHSTIFSITNNTLISCVASSSTTRNSISGFGSYGANVYGGGVSIVAGAYSYSFGINEGSGCRSEVSGDTALSTLTYMFHSNILSSCHSSSINSGGASSDGANSYGGGLSFIVGAYSYSYNQGGVSSDSLVSGITIISVGNFTIDNNTLHDCIALSETTGFSVGSDGNGGGIALMLGAYCYRFGNVGGSGISAVSGITAVTNATYYLTNNIFENCSVVSRNDRNSLRASCFGGAVSLIYRPQIYPETIQSITQVGVTSSSALVSNTTFRRCIASTTSESCASSSSNAAGGALYFRMPSGLINITKSYFESSSASVLCSAFSSSSFGLGGGVSVFRANYVIVSFSEFEDCFARGVPQGNNVMVSGGGLHVGDSEALFFQDCVIRRSSIRDAFSTFLQSGGGALGTWNLSIVHISRSQFLDNGDSSESGIVFLLQQKNQSMVVTIAHSLISTAPSQISALHVSCGKVCPEEQQRRIVVSFDHSNVAVMQSDRSNTRRESSSLMSMPEFSPVNSENSFLNCSFTGTSELAVLTQPDKERLSTKTIECGPCQRSFEVTSTSEDLNLAKFSEFLNMRQQCESLASSSSQQCPYGVVYCTTYLNVTVGFWTNFSADGKLKNPSLCPPKYCGCRNIGGYSDRACRLYAPLSPKFFADDALCNHNRSGVLCGGCKSNFTQSLNGYSCVPNDDCLRNMGWTWALSVLGYIAYSGYIVTTSSTANNGLIMCVLLYGQMSSFASIPSVVAANAQRSISSSWLSQVSQFTSIASLYSDSCYGPDMGAYGATLFRLSGPAIVFLSSLLITVFAKRLFKRHIGLRQTLATYRIHVSYTATITNVLLLLFSNVNEVVFLLITCQRIGDGNNVVFIDGTVQCDGPGYAGLIFIATILCLVPVLFWAGLIFNKIPAKARAVACSPFLEARQYWVAASLLFRFSMTIISATYRQLPSVQSMVLAILTISMLMLLIALRPYIYYRTFFMDIFCYTCLSVQFLLASLVRASESLGMAAGPANNFFSTMNNAAEASIILRYAFFLLNCKITP
jgi:hypothetical protein